MNLKQRFYAKIALPKSADDCWQWIGATNNNGYGQLSVGGARKAAHRLSYELLVGSIPDGIIIDHLCFNPGCVNPAHLRAITQKQNQEHRRGAQRNSTSGVRGVYWDSGRRKWYVRVRHNGRQVHGGYFATLEDAEQRAIELRAELFSHDDWEGAA